jgi:hypothetical protein
MSLPCDDYLPEGILQKEDKYKTEPTEQQPPIYFWPYYKKTNRDKNIAECQTKKTKK